MKKFAKTGTLIICLLMCVLMFAACADTTGELSQAPETSATPEPSQQAEVKNYFNAGEDYRIFMWDNYKENEAVNGKSGTRAIERRDKWLNYTDKYGISITYIAAPSNWLIDVPTSAAANEPICDIMACGGPFVLPLIYSFNGQQAAVLYALSDYSYIDDFSNDEYWNTDAQKTACTYQGKLYFTVRRDVGFGSVAYNQVTFFNYKLIANGGYTADQLYDWSKSGEWTFEKLRQVAIDCTDADNEIYGMNLGQNTCAIFAMVAANGGTYFEKNEDGITRFNGTSRKVIDAIDAYLLMANVDKSVYFGNNVGHDDDHPDFVLGKHALMITYCNRAEKMAKEGADIKYGILMPPKGPDADDYISDVNWMSPYCIIKPTKNVEGCVQIMSEYIRDQYAASSDDAKMLFEAEAVANIKDTRAMETLEMLPSKSKFSPVMCYTSVQDGSGKEMGSYLWGSIKQWISGESTPELLYASAESAINSILDSIEGSKE